MAKVADGTFVLNVLRHLDCDHGGNCVKKLGRIDFFFFNQTSWMQQ